MRIVSIPREKLPFLKKNIEKLQEVGSVKIFIEEKDLNARIEGESDKEYFTEKVLNALFMGFPVEKALKLYNEKYFFEVIDLSIVLNGNEKLIERYKGRLIGKGGKSKKIIQELSGCFISFDSDCVGLIGEYDSIQKAKEAIKMLLEGARHASVYAFLEKSVRE